MSLPKFSPTTLQDIGGGVLLGRLVETRHGTLARCDCGQLRHSFVIIDVRHIDGVDQDFACDGCWTDWQRRRVPLHENHVTDVGKKHNAVWLKDNGFDDKNAAKVLKLPLGKLNAKGLVHIPKRLAERIIKLTRIEWDAEWFRQHGAPEAVITMMKKMKRRS